MNFEIIIKQVREEIGISLEELSEETGIQKLRLENIEAAINKDNILFIEMLVIAENLNVDITDLYNIKRIELQ